MQPPAGQSRFQITSKPARKWGQTERGRTITVARKKLIGQNTKIFALGSCFAMEIRNRLRESGYDVYPKIMDIKFDPSRVQPAALPDRDNFNFYDTFLIRQEIERALGRRK